MASDTPTTSVPAPVFFGPGQNASPAPGYTPPAPAPVTAPVTTPPVIPGSPNTSGPSRTTTNQSSSLLSQYIAQYAGVPTTSNPAGSTPTDTANENTNGLDPNDPFIASLNNLSATSDAATKALIANTQAQYQQSVQTANKQYDSYKAGLQQLGVETNEAESTPDLLAGHILQAGNEQAQKIQSLQSAETKAIADANLAKQNNDFKTLNEKMKYVSDLQTQKLDAVKAANDAVTFNNAQTKFAEGQVTYNATAINTEFNNLKSSGASSDDLNKFIQAVGQYYGASPSAVVSALTAEQQKEQTTALDTESKNLAIANASVGTAAKDQAYTDINNILDNNLKTSNGDATVDSNGFMTPEGFHTLVQNAAKSGITTSEFLSEYGDKLDPNNYDQYGLTARQISDLEAPANSSPSGAGGSTPNPFATQ